MYGDVRTSRDAKNDRPGRPWAMLAVGLAAGLIGMHFTVVRPTRAELDDVRREMAAVRVDLDGLVGRRDQIWQANTLLAGLKDQTRLVAEAGDAVETLRQFRIDVESEGAKSLEALASLDVLSSLQQTLIESRAAAEAARGELARVVALQKELAASGGATAAARESVAKLAAIQQTVIAEAGKTAAAAGTLDRMVATNRRLAEERETAAVADASLTAMADVQAKVIVQSSDAAKAQAGLAKLAGVKTTAIAESAKADEAFAGLVRFMSLADAVRKESAGVKESEKLVRDLGTLVDAVATEAENVYVARDAAERLVSLRDGLARRAEPERTAVAVQSAETLSGLRDRLAAGASNGTAARTNLDVLLSIQTDLTAQTKGVVDAVQALELLGDLRQELTDHVHMMQGVRRDLVELALMESAVGRAVRVLEPLTRLSDLQRLTDDEVRTAARAILDGRNAATEPVPSRVATESTEATTR